MLRPVPDRLLPFIEFLNSLQDLHQMPFVLPVKDVEGVYDRVFRLEAVAFVWVFSR